MTHTVETLMALAYKIRDARTYEWDVSEAVEAGNTLRTALTEALAQPVRDDEFATRGELAARLKCWHRLTREESDELVDLLRAQPVREPLTQNQMWYLWNAQGSDEMNQTESFAFARAIERAHGIGGEK